MYRYKIRHVVSLETMSLEQADVWAGHPVSPPSITATGANRVIVVEVYLF